MSTELTTLDHPPALVGTEQNASPLPLFRGPQMAEALAAYKDLQRTLDTAMPDQIMELDGKPFRKKGYWRAVAVAFNLTVEPIDERRDVNSVFEDGRENFGYVVTYRASANGRSATGDGSCFAVEKARRFRCPHPHPTRQGKTEHWPAESCPEFDPAFQWRTLPAQATEHNIRSHAHTRAFNRAVSNLVGFGEVSAEEVERDELADARPVGNGHTPQASQAQQFPPARPPQAARREQPISEAQCKRMYSIAMQAGWSKDEYHAYLKRRGITDDRETPRGIYDQICNELQQGFAEGA
jgi:hypothetical protein